MLDRSIWLTDPPDSARIKYQPFKKKQIAVYSVRASFPHTLLFVSLRNCDSVGFIMPKTVFVCGVAQPGNKMASMQGRKSASDSLGSLSQPCILLNYQYELR